MTDATPPGRTPGGDPEHDDGLGAIQERLRRERPVPLAAFRGELRSRLLLLAGGRTGRVRAAIIAYATSGAALLGVAGAGVAGLGPLAA
jgi:hypothetical protein